MKGPTMTLGEFRAMTADLPDNTLVTAYDPHVREWYVNLEVTQEAKDHFILQDTPSLVLDIVGDVDTRQW